VTGTRRSAEPQGRSGALVVLALATFALALVGTGEWRRMAERRAQEPLALMTSLPIYWGEQGDIAQILKDTREPPWVRRVIERRYPIATIDSIGDEKGEPVALGRLRKLAIVQPRALTPQDNVALDSWLRRGGRLLFVLDPMLTGVYQAPLASPEHPSVIGLKPPVLERWGLDMVFDESQGDDPRLVRLGVGVIPVQLAGALRLRPGARCEVIGDGLIARCRIARGQVVVVADAFAFEPQASQALGAWRQARAIDALLFLAFELPPVKPSPSRTPARQD